MDIVRRGYVPQDAVEFGPKYRDFMERAAVEVGFLINRGYDVKSASTFVGNHDACFPSGSAWRWLGYSPQRI